MVDIVESIRSCLLYIAVGNETEWNMRKPIDVIEKEVNTMLK